MRVFLIFSSDFQKIVLVKIKTERISKDGKRKITVIVVVKIRNI